MNPILNFYQLSPYATPPKFGTQQAACFDIAACLKGRTTEVFGETKREAAEEIYLYKGDRVAIPTGLILDIPEGYSVRLHPRSGLSLKNGITMANCEGIIDSDYVDELKIIIINVGHEPYVIKHGDRICQGELIKTLDYTINQCYTPPTQKTDRNGGFGSTGVSTCQ
jgi:dUTP pyrophosphatase